MHHGVSHRRPPQSSAAVGFLMCALIVLSGTCELDPPTAPPADWEFSCQGTLQITDGVNGRMTQAQLSFTSITAPPENFYYQTYFAAGAESVFVGTLKPDPKTNHAGLTWDEATRGQIPSAYQQLRINLMRIGSASAYRMLVRSWWGDPVLPGLRQLFGESRLAFQVLDEAQKLETASAPIRTASSVEDAKQKISALAHQQAIWRSKATLVEVTCNSFASDDTSLTSALSGFRTAYECAIGVADTLVVSCAALLQSQETSLTYYTSAGNELRTQVEAVKAQTEAIYFFCRLFAVLKIVPRPG